MSIEGIRSLTWLLTTREFKSWAAQRAGSYMTERKESLTPRQNLLHVPGQRTSGIHLDTRDLRKLKALSFLTRRHGT